MKTYYGGKQFLTFKFNKHVSALCTCDSLCLKTKLNRPNSYQNHFTEKISTNGSLQLNHFTEISTNGSL